MPIGRVDSASPKATARPTHPRDKAKVEVGVQVAQRRILARLRNQTFFSLDAMNERIGELLDFLNSRKMRVYAHLRPGAFPSPRLGVGQRTLVRATKLLSLAPHIRPTGA